MALQFNTLFSIRGAVLLEFPIFKFSTGTTPSKVALHLLPLDESSQPKCSYGTERNRCSPVYRSVCFLEFVSNATAHVKYDHNWCFEDIERQQLSALHIPCATRSNSKPALRARLDLLGRSTPQPHGTSSVPDGCRWRCGGGS